MEYSRPPSGGPSILPRESNDDKKPVTLPCPEVTVFVKTDETLGLITPLPIPKMLKNIAAVMKLSTSRISAKPIADTRMPP